MPEFVRENKVYYCVAIPLGIANVVGGFSFSPIPLFNIILGSCLLGFCFFAAVWSKIND